MTDRTQNLLTQCFGFGDEQLGWQEIAHEKYHDIPGVSSSHLKFKTPAHFASLVLERTEPTPAMVFGTDVHSAILEGKEFEFIESPKLKKDEAHNDRIHRIYACRDSVMSHPDASRILTGGVAERAGFYRDVHTDLLLKIKPDYLTEGYIVDVKTCTDASDVSLPAIINKYGYHISAAFYLDVANAINGSSIDSFAWIFVESISPFASNVVWADPELLEVGRRAYRGKLERIKECLLKNSWPGYETGIKFVSLPLWAKGNE